MSLAGLVLCGGVSSRMGQPKAWLPFGGEVLLQRTVAVLREVTSLVAVVAAKEQELPVLPGDVVIVRDESAGLGPLQGLVSGLKWLKGKADGAYVTGCDGPFLTAEFVRKVADFFDGERAVVPLIARRLHPLAAVYPLAALPVIEEELAAGRLRLIDLFTRLPSRFLAEADFREIDPLLRSLRNVNTPGDYAAALNETECGRI